jgi:peptidoglycan/LPS O-acetylase OafA/YrhL
MKESAAKSGAKPRLLYIDCIRGYAVLMVITSHVTDKFPNLPYPVHRLTVTGWFGVQLFFLASCLTLLMSWNFEINKTKSVDVVGFFIRRFFRIAPAYYAAGVLYYFLLPPKDGFDAWQVVTSMTFINAWTPAWTPTVQTAWTVVPGGWSIGVEYTFYLVFPLFATWTTSLTRALIGVLASIVIGVLANYAALAALSGSYKPAEVDNFLYFWFLNQMSVFALGGVLFFILGKMDSLSKLWRAFLQNNATLFAAGALAAFCALAYVPLGHRLGAAPYIPASLAISIPLMGLIIALSAGRGLLVNRYAAAMGRVSFSVYLLHFAILRLFEVFPEELHTHATGIRAIFAFAVGWIVTVLITYVASWASYGAIEQPMMDIGKALIRARRLCLVTIATGPPNAQGLECGSTTNYATHSGSRIRPASVSAVSAAKSGRDRTR